MKELGCFYEALEPQRLGGTSPCISPNIKIIRRITCLRKNASYSTEESLNHEEGPKMMESWNCK
jgi:hypothetical protein